MFIYLYNIHGREKIYMSIKSFVRSFRSNFYDINNYLFEQVDPNLIRYFRTEYGRDWKIALEHYLYKKNLNNEKKVA